VQEGQPLILRHCSLGMETLVFTYPSFMAKINVASMLAQAVISASA
jgi:hypothetical protein